METKNDIELSCSSTFPKNSKDKNEFSIGDVCLRFSSGKGITTDKINPVGEYPIYGGNGVRGYTDSYNFEGQCAVIGRQGAYCGNVKYFTGKAYMTEHAIIGVTKQEHDNRYFAYKLMLLNLGRFSGQAAQPGLSVAKLKALKITMPILSIQQKITSILSAYDTLIENNTRRIRLLEQMAENFYKEWFVRFRFPGHENVEMVNGLPKGWESCAVSSIIDVMSGGTPKTTHKEYYDGKIPFYTPKDATDSIFVYSTLTNITEDGLAHCNSQLYPRNTLIITARGTVGKLNLLSVPMAMNQSCFALQFKQKDNPYFLYYAIRTEVAGLKKIANGGIFDTIVIKSFDHIKLTIPPLSLMNNFNLKVCPILEQVKNLSYQNTLLTRQRDLLLPRLMSGKIEVKP